METLTSCHFKCYSLKVVFSGCIRRGTTTKEFEKVVKKEIKNALKKECETEVNEDEGNSSKNEKKKARFKDR